MKLPSSYNNIPEEENVNLPPEEVKLAQLIPLDDRIVMALVDIVFSQKHPDDPAS